MTLRISGGRRLISPAGLAARPTTSRVRLAVMNLLSARLEGARWLDLCCGSGVMSCEALQRGVAAVVAVDQDRAMAATARTNLETVRAGLRRPVTVEVLCRPLPRWLEGGGACRTAGGPFDLIYVDPPYGAGLHQPIAAAVLQHGWMAAGGLLVWECGSGRVPEAPLGWELSQQRRYGSSEVVVLRPLSQQESPAESSMEQGPAERL